MRLTCATIVGLQTRIALHGGGSSSTQVSDTNLQGTRGPAEPGMRVVVLPKRQKTLQGTEVKAGQSWRTETSATAWRRYGTNYVLPKLRGWRSGTDIPINTGTRV
jgi:hypothetical protein